MFEWGKGEECEKDGGNEMNVLSLFDGMSCGQIALKELGHDVIYYASEIDQHAIKQTQLNFPDTIQLGSVTEWRNWDIDWSTINLVLAGSPCQGFSFAGKQLAFDDPRSKLFFVFVEILNHVKKFNPDVKFLLENVNMKKDHLRVISEYVGVFPVNINSNLVSAQNRDRWYWTNIRTKKVGLFDELYVDIPQPEDKGILLKDILEDDIDEKYFLSDKMIAGFTNKKGDFGERFKIQDQDNLNDKGACVTQNLYKIQVTADFIKVDQPACVRFGRSDEGKELRKQSMRKGKDHTPFQAKEIIGFDYNKMNTITCATTKDNLVMQINPSKESGGKQPYQHNRIYDTNGIAPCLNIDARSPGVFTQSRIRRLPPTECARLQTIPDWYKWGCSDTQIYRMCGNGWTVEVIKHILSFLP